MKNLFSYYLKSCREEKGLSLREFGALCQLSHTHIDSLEKGKDFRTGKKVSPTQETIEKIANGLMIREQALFNLSLEKVNSKFNCFLHYKEREEIKATARNILNDPQSQKNFSIEQLLKYQEDIFIALFSRSVEASDFNIEHVDFNTYVAMLLHQEHFKTKINKELYDALLKKYGTCEGIPEGTTYIQDIKFFNRDNHTQDIECTTAEKNFILKYKKLDEHSKSLVNTIIDKELERVEPGCKIAAWGAKGTEGDGQPPIEEVTT